MDGMLLEVTGTIVTVLAANLGLYLALGDKIDKVRKDVSTNASKIAELQAKTNDFPKFCDERHQGISQRLEKLERDDTKHKGTGD